MAVVALLPVPLESFDARDGLADLLHAGGAVVPPPRRVPYRAFGRLPVPVGAALARALAERIALPAPPSAVAIFDPLQLPLAEALLARHPAAELRYFPPARYTIDAAPWPALRTSVRALHLRAELRAAAGGAAPRAGATSRAAAARG